jgi:hypothetical protein
VSIGFGGLQQRVDHRTGIRADWRISLKFDDMKLHDPELYSINQNAI